MANLTNFSFEFFYEIFTEDASLRFLYHGAKKSKMTKNSIQGGSYLEKYSILFSKGAFNAEINAGILCDTGEVVEFHYLYSDTLISSLRLHLAFQS